MNITKNQHIIDGIIAGDNSVLKSFYKRNLPPVRRLILKYNGITEDVEDIFQEALVLLYHKLRSGDLELHKSIHIYFIGICKNMWRNQLRKQRISEYYQLCEKSTPDPSDSIIDTLTKKHQQNVFNKHFDTLSNTNKSILRLFFEEKSNRDIANITGCSEGYTRKKKCIIKERLHKMVQSDPIYGELVVC
ncbi:sigma-70 family RNA polymerase sigma factor [uncultured Aquimarina sp.]|uniref:RNA polymerase sigma factor n=1 Tax=uncultured Aquimarina sp. TaxID=575652 RepID=UPI002627B0BD|nr:sigma-70 family RNA polymerase sigma factor [uncultured Aquimarina sp.]